uniref:V-SNARE coiled-coil homology domain-containing protein n=1 Tax=Nothoprocta perdicaria TaxID=30464 RepID=A0A8C6ZQD2_NOTPE
MASVPFYVLDVYVLYVFWSRSASAPTQGPTSAGGAGLPSAGGGQSHKRMQQTQAQVDEVVGIIRMNVDKVLERDQKLSELDNRADALQAGASQFETSAAKLKRKYWWKNCKVNNTELLFIHSFIHLLASWLHSPVFRDCW